ncbi:MAG: ABC transporter permease [Bacteroidales bacterium]|nr:ABC transporter permease [Bacteroidota bacterium]MBL6949705.1 ABC transporter permease [Bacteroidales bacterium]
METIKIAWRNLWRNKRRTLITSASVFFAIFLALLMRAFQLGSYDLMVHNIVHAYSGYFQVHETGYWDDKIINNTFEYSPELVAAIDEVPEILGYAPRLESFALGSYGTKTKGVMVNGVVPDEEDNLTGLRKKLVEGEYLTPDDDGALVSQKLAEYLKTGIGDTLVLIGQGYHGMSAAGIFPVKGIVHFPSPELDGRMIFLSLPTAQSLFSADNMLTSLAFNLAESKNYRQVAHQLKAKLNPEIYEVMTWEEMMPEVVQQIESDNGSGLIMLAILYMIVGFGIFGTILMMFSERIREFGMMIAIGMQKIKLTRIVATELIFIGLLGVLAGTAAAIPLIYYFFLNPIPLTGEMAEATISMGFEPVMPVAWEPSYFFAQAITVFVILLMVMILPVVKISRLTVINALRR